MRELYDLIDEAKFIANAHRCELGHAWVVEGGRICPKYGEHIHCSQAVYVCRMCGEVDYGYVGGPAYDDCFNQCKIET